MSIVYCALDITFNIFRNSPAARYLAFGASHPGEITSYAARETFFLRDFNSFGSRRGNDAVMARGTFGNIRLVYLIFSQHPLFTHSGEQVSWQDGAKDFAYPVKQHPRRVRRRRAVQGGRLGLDCAGWQGLWVWLQQRLGSKGSVPPRGESRHCRKLRTYPPQQLGKEFQIKSLVF